MFDGLAQIIHVACDCGFDCFLDGLKPLQAYQGLCVGERGHIAVTM
jgi:hypothetical protein